jgi:hypothetical protein
MPLSTDPVPLADLTADQLIGVDLVHALDPARPGYDVWLPVSGPVAPGEGTQVLTVAIDRNKAAEQLAALRGLIRVAAGS